ncbi:MAG: CHAT domain-containing protein, partial [Bacteroidota bacterium]
SSTMLEYFWGDSTLFIFSISEGQIFLHKNSIHKNLSEDLERLLTRIREPDMSMESLYSFVSSAESLYDRLIPQIVQTFPTKNLYVVPDGPLSYLPFEVLIAEHSFAKSNSSIPSQVYRDLAYLFKEYNIHYVYSASLLSVKKQYKQSQSGELATFAPEYKGPLQLQLNQGSAQQIEGIIGGMSFLGSQASESNFKSEADNFRAIHLAAHGNANVEIPINAYLDFGNDEGTEEDGQLYAYELYSLSLKNELVSLIACEAGFGKLESGEGVFSLARAFEIAGAKSIMTSLWRADGRAASPISEKFYLALKSGKKPSEALQSSKIEFLEQASPDMTHPYFWATYIITGRNEVIWTPFFKTYGRWLILGIVFILLFSYFKIKSKKIKLS